MSILRLRQSFGRFLKPILYAILVGFVITGIWTTYGSYVSDDGRDKEGAKGVLATVNGQEISYAAYYDALRRLEMDAEDRRINVPVSQMAQQKGMVIDQLIEQQLRLQAASGEDIKVSKKQVRQKIDEIVNQQIDSYRQAITGGKKMSDKEIDKLLASQSRPTNLRKISGEIRKSLDPDAVRVQLMIEGLDKLLDARFKNVTDQEWMNSYKQMRARHVLISSSSRPEEQAKRRAEEVLKKIRNGGDFAALAKEYSDDPGSKDKGGELDWFGTGAMVPEFEKAAFALKAGQVSDLVKTDYGYHIIRVEETRQQLPEDFEKNKKKLREDFATSHVNRKKNEYYSDVKQKAKITVNDAELQGYMAMQTAYQAKSREEFEKKIVEAMRAYERATSEPENHTAWIMLAEIRMQRGQKDEAQKIYENLLDGTNPIEDAELRMKLGQLYLEKKQNDKALEQFQIAGDVGYSNLMIQYQLQQLYKQLGHEDLAAEAQKTVEELSEQMREEQEQNAPQPDRGPEAPPAAGE